MRAPQGTGVRQGIMENRKVKLKNKDFSKIFKLIESRKTHKSTLSHQISLLLRFNILPAVFILLIYAAQNKGVSARLRDI